MIAWIKNQYDGAATTTLVTKVLLGTLACVPAYDRYFIKGLRLRRLSYSRLNATNFGSLLEFVQQRKNLVQFERAQIQIERTDGKKYPIMKVIDMYFWQLGKDESSRIG